MSESIKTFIENLHRVETLSESLSAEVRAQMARSFRNLSSEDKDKIRGQLFQDLVKGAEALGLVIGQVKNLLSLPEGFQALPINGDSVELRLREVHARLVDAAGVLTEAGELLFPEN
jgi:hypothetical protein